MAEIKSNPAELAALAAADSTAKKRLTYLYDEGRDKNKANSEDDPWN